MAKVQHLYGTSLVKALYSTAKQFVTHSHVLALVSLPACGGKHSHYQMATLPFEPWLPQLIATSFHCPFLSMRVTQEIKRIPFPTPPLMLLDHEKQCWGHWKGKKLNDRTLEAGPSWGLQCSFFSVSALFSAWFFITWAISNGIHNDGSREIPGNANMCINVMKHAGETGLLL